MRIDKLAGLAPISFNFELVFTILFGPPTPFGSISNQNAQSK